MASQLPVRRVTAYNRWGTATVVDESVAGPLSGAPVTQARTTTTTVDGADRITQVSITGTGAGVGESVSSTQSVYDVTTGEVVAVRAVAGTGTVLSETSKEYDRLGRLVTYRDGAGATTTTEYSRFGEPVSATDSVTDALGSRTIGTVAYTYDRSVDPRRYVTSFTDSVAGTFGATWGPDGQLESQSLPGDVTLRISYDPARVPVARTYTRTSDGVLIAADSVVENHRGQWVKHSSDTGVRTYGYDRLGRLSSVTDKASIAGACTTRGYGYDTHANRTQFASATGEAAADCPTADLQSTATYDSVDRLVTSVAGGDQWRYDPLGRVVSMPSATPGGTAVENGFYVNDLVSSQTIPGEAKVAWSLDAIQRRSGFTTSAWVDGAWADAVTKVSHYGSDSDELVWIAEDASLAESVTRYVSGVEGDVAMTTSLSGDRELQLVDLHGDIVATLPIPDTEPAAQFGTTLHILRRVRCASAPQRIWCDDRSTRTVWMARGRTAVRRGAQRRHPHGRAVVLARDRSVPQRRLRRGRLVLGLRLLQRGPGQLHRPGRYVVVERDRQEGCGSRRGCVDDPRADRCRRSRSVCGRLRFDRQHQEGTDDGGYGRRGGCRRQRHRWSREIYPQGRKC